MRPPASGVPAALTAARVLVATALALLAAAAAFMFVVGVEFASRPDDGETTWVHLEAFLLGFAGAAIGSCTAIVGLARASRRVALAGAGGVAVGAAIFMVTLESQSPRDEEIEYWRGLFVLVLGLAVAAALVASRLRRPMPRDAPAG